MFLLGILFKRINAAGATTAVIAGFVLSILLKVFVRFAWCPLWLQPFMMQATVNWAFSNYPSDFQAMDIFAHGGGMVGFGTDDTLVAVRDALRSR